MLRSCYIKYLFCLFCVSKGATILSTQGKHQAGFAPFSGGEGALFRRVLWPPPGALGGGLSRAVSPLGWVGQDLVQRQVSDVLLQSVCTRHTAHGDTERSGLAQAVILASPGQAPGGLKAAEAVLALAFAVAGECLP